MSTSACPDAGALRRMPVASLTPLALLAWRCEASWATRAIWSASATVFFCSDEHVTFIPDGPVKVGDRIVVRPAHVDPTVAYHERMQVVSGAEVVETWAVDLRGW